MFSLKKDLKELCFTYGVSSFEKETGILNYIYSKVKKINSRTNIDNYGIIIESAYAYPVSFSDFGMIIPKIGNGTAIQTQGENFIIDFNVIDNIQRLAIKNGIKFQKEEPSLDLGRTNCSELQKISGLKCCAINIPVQNQHQSLSKTSLDDFYETYKMIIKIIEFYKCIF